ncbi:MAG: FAD-binding oxidoreductase [Turneriella sp.]
MNRHGAGEDNLLSAYDSLSRIVGREHSILPGDLRFSDFLHDETYLQGEAALVLRPASGAEIQALVKELSALRARFPGCEDDLSFTIRGGGSGLSGACVPQRGVVLDCTRLNQIFDVDEDNLVIRAGAGVILSEINDHLQGTGLFYPVDPSSLTLCTVGGSVATNAAGPASLKYGTTRQSLAALRLINASGDNFAAGALPVKTSMGFSFPDLACGSEGRLGVVIEATLRLKPRPETHALLLAAFATEQAAVDFILSLRRVGIVPRAIELIDAYSSSLVDLPFSGQVLLMVEFDGTAMETAHALERVQQVTAAVDWYAARDEKNRHELWSKRKAVSPAIKQKFPYRLGEDVAVPLTALPAVCDFARRHAAQRGVATAIWGHAGDGNLHINYLLEHSAMLPLLDQLMPELAHEVTRVGGAISGEHGLGRLKQKYARAVMPAEYFAVQQRIKAAFDPGMLFNRALDK